MKRKWTGHTPEARARIAAARRGKKHSDETKEKIRAAARARWARWRARMAEEQAAAEGTP